MGPIVLDLTCRFKRELINREWIQITSKTIEVKRKIMRMQQCILKEDGSVSSEAEFTLGFMDLKLRKMIEPPIEWLNALGIDKLPEN